MNTRETGVLPVRVREAGCGTPAGNCGRGRGASVRIFVLAFALALSGAASAQPAQQQSPWTFSVSGSAGSVGEAKLDGGGNVSLGLVSGSAGVNYSPDWNWSAGINFNAADYRFDFSGNGGLALLNPWSDVGFATVSLPLRYSFDRQWGVFVQPSYQRAATRNADDGEANQWGAVAAVTHTSAARQVIGVGASVFTGLEKTRVFPFLLIDWQLNDRMRLANPLAAGPTGPAGLEIVYALGGGWEVSGGGAYRSLRFRLDRDLAAAPNGIGEYSGVMGFGRLSYRFSPQASLDLYLGGVFGTSVKLQDSRGNAVLSEDAKSAPIAALSFRARF